MAKIINKKSSVVGKIPAPADLEYGELALNYADGKLFYKASNNSIQSFGGAALSNAVRQQFTATAGQTNFSINYTPGQLDVYLNGVKLVTGSDYTATTGTGFTLTTAATAGDIVDVVAGIIFASSDWIYITNKPTTLSGFGITDAQALSTNLTAISALTGTNGFVRTNGSGTWSVDANTYITGNQNIVFSGDATGNGTTSVSLTLANSGVTAGLYGSTTNIPQITVDAKGRVTSVTNVAVSIPSGSLTFTGDVTGTGTTGSSTALTLTNSGVTAGTYTKVTVDAKGRATSGTTLSASDIPSLDASKITSGTIDAARLPSYVDDVLEYTNLASFPATGETAKIYIALDTNKTYRWSGSAYIEISASPGTTDSLVEGSTNLYFTNARARGAISVTQNLTYNSTTGVITGPNLSSYLTGNQTITFSGDATGSGATSVALTLANSGVTAGTYTKVTVDAKGRVTTGAALASADLPIYTGTITSSQITTGLGFTPYNSTNPSGYITSSALTPYLTTATASSTYLPLSGGTTTGSVHVGAAIGSRGTSLSVSGSNASSPFAAKSGGYSTVFAVLPWAGGQTYLSTGTYYDGSSWVHDSSDTTNALFAFSGGSGATWYASNNSSPSWNTASAVALWNQSGTWTGALNAGSGAQVAGNTIVHAGNYNSYSPTLTGSGASGTWGINITGNAATTSQRSFGSDIATSGQGRFTGWYDGGSGNNALAVEVGVSGGAGYIISYNRSTSSYQTLALNGTNIQLIPQGGTLTGPSGNVILHAGNYNSYALPLTGGSLTGSLAMSDSGYIIGSNHFEKHLYASFPNGTANLAADIQFGNLSFWGYIEVEITGTYSNQNTAGKLTKLFAVGTNPGNLIYNNVSRVADTMGTIVDNIVIGEFAWDATNSTYRIPISHIVSTGNGYTIRVRMFTHGGGASNVYSALTLSSNYTLTALAQQSVSFNGNLLINGTNQVLHAGNYTNYITSGIPSQTGNSGKFLTTDGTNTSWAVLPLPPGAPSTCTATASATAGQVDVSWSASSLATSYTIYYGTTTPLTTANSQGSVSVGNVTSGSVTGITNYNTYYFAVVGINSNGIGGLSPQSSAIPNNAPAAPTLTSVNVTSGTSVSIAWTGVTAQPSATYRVYYSLTSPVTTSSSYVTATTSPTSITGLTANTTYYFKVAAINSYGTTLSTQSNATTPPAGTVIYSAGNTLSISGNTYQTIFVDSSVTKMRVRCVGGSGGGGGGWNSPGAAGGYSGFADAEITIANIPDRVFYVYSGGAGTESTNNPPYHAYYRAGGSGGGGSVVYGLNNGIVYVAGGAGGGGGSGWNGTAGTGGNGGQVINATGVGNGSNGATTQSAGGTGGSSVPGTNSANSSANGSSYSGGNGGDQGGSGGAANSTIAPGGYCNTTYYWGGGGGGGGYRGGAGGWGSSAGDGGGGGSSYVNPSYCTGYSMGSAPSIAGGAGGPGPGGGIASSGSSGYVTINFI